MIPSARHVIVLYFCICFAAVSAAVGQYRFDLWTTDNGLPQNGVREITQTPEGYLWFTTFDGLVRFDGVTFTTFNKSNTKGIINNRFTGIYADTDGTIYATTMEDGVLTIYRNGQFSSMTSEQVPGNHIARIEKDETGGVRFLVEDEDRKGRTWYRMVGDKFEFIEKFQPGNADRTFVGRTGIKWTLTSEGITAEHDSKTVFTPVALKTADLRRNAFEDSDGGLWIGDTQVYYIRNGVLTTFGEPDGLPGSSVYHSFWEEADGSVWFSSGGASSAGIGLVQYKNGNLSFWGKEHGLLSASIQDVFHDREGITWLATVRGLSRRRIQTIQGYSLADGLDHSETYPLYRDSRDNIWVGTSKGLNIYRDGKFEQLDLRPPSKDVPVERTWRKGRMSVQSLWEDANGKMWVGLNGGIFVIDGNVATMIYMGSHVYAIKNDSKGNVWAATNKGLLQFNGYELTRQYSTSDGLPNEFMTFILEDSKGNLWFGGYGGLSRMENGGFVNLTAKDGLVGNYVRTIFEDTDGTLWIGTYDEGLSRYKDGRFVSYREENGLYSSGVFAIEPDVHGAFWISSNRGIYRVKRQELNDFADGKITKINSVGYGKDDGMLSNECNGGRQPASIRDKDGRLWFPTQEGVAVLDPDIDRANPLAPSVVIENVLVEREPVDYRNGLTIEPGRKDLEIQYTGISLIKSDQVKFQYQLEGHDANWIDAGTRRTAHYSYLPPGQYTFRVRAANSDGIWAETPAEIKIKLQPYFYQTYGFYAIAFLSVALMLTAVWRASVYQLRSRERRLTHLVAERTAELAKANEDLERLANSDSLTKIGNRRRFESFLTDEWHRAIRFKTEISLILLDIDHFKNFNDTYGHQAGDECLQLVADAFADTIKRPTDLVARFGGEEFAIVLGGTDEQGALTIAEEAVANVKALSIIHSSSGTGPVLTVSVGIATLFATMDRSEHDLIRAADQALYEAKKNGRDRIHVYDSFAFRPIGETVLSENFADAN